MRILFEMIPSRGVFPFLTHHGFNHKFIIIIFLLLYMRVQKYESRWKSSQSNDKRLVNNMHTMLHLKE